MPSHVNASLPQKDAAGRQVRPTETNYAKTSRLFAGVTGRRTKQPSDNDGDNNKKKIQKKNNDDDVGELKIATHIH